MKIIALTALIGVLYFNCNQLHDDNNIFIINKESNSVLRNLVHKNIIRGKVFKNDLEKTKSDSIVELYFDKPHYQGYPIDSVYFLSFDGNNLKILAKSEYEKGLIYLEGNKAGFHMRFFSFGGYVQKVSNVEIHKLTNTLNLTFNYFAWSSTMPKPIPQKVKIITKNNKVDFEVYFVDEKGKELKVPLD